jgi:hypothetical protein
MTPFTKPGRFLFAVISPEDSSLSCIPLLKGNEAHQEWLLRVAYECDLALFKVVEEARREARDCADFVTAVEKGAWSPTLWASSSLYVYQAEFNAKREELFRLVRNLAGDEGVSLLVSNLKAYPPK